MVNHNFKDMTGQRFGKLVVVERAENRSGEPARWMCKCDCGGSINVVGTHLRKNLTHSCGCIVTEMLVKRNTKHNQTETRLHNVWMGMKQRCNYPNHISYRRYGARGILVCDEWSNDYRTFMKWSLENGYDDTAPRGQCTLDRIDNDGPYSPENCRWVSMAVQGKNRSKKTA